MLMKRTLLATSALALIASVSQANADIYITILGGGDFLKGDNSGEQVSIPFTRTAYRFDSDTGFVIAGAAGMHFDRWLRGLRAEIEASYRRNDVKGSWSSDTFFGSGSGPIDANLSNFALLANVWYDINVGMKFAPYLGGGVGWDRAEFDGIFVGGGPQFHFENSGFAYQLGGGLNYPIQDGVNIGFGYRFFRGPSIKNDIFVGKNNLPARFGDNENHTVMINLTIETD